MVFTPTLSLSLLVAVIIPTAVFGQTSSTPVPAETTVRLPKQAPSDGLTRLVATLSTVEASDSLLTKRTFFSTTVTQQGNRLNRRSIIQQLEDSPQAQAVYRRGQLLKPIGPLLIASGLVIGYIAVKGTAKTAYARGIGTPANPSPPDVLVDYTSRSLPQFVGGVGLLLGGLCLIEMSNGLTAKSINLYNANIIPHRSVTGLRTVKLGINAAGNLGFEANF